MGSRRSADATGPCRLIVHAVSAAVLEAACAGSARCSTSGRGRCRAAGQRQSGYRPEGDHEPFGFHDGIAQPSIAGITGDGVPTGEFILGYPNHSAIIPPTPVVPSGTRRRAVLPPLANPYHAHASLRDLGLNGSYVVYRKLQQDVAGFWQFMKREAVREAPAGKTPATWSGWRRAASAVGPAARRWCWPQMRDDPQDRRSRRFPLPGRSRRSRLPTRRAHPPHQPTRRSQAVSIDAVAQHVGGASPAPPGAGVRADVVRSGCPEESRKPSPAARPCSASPETAAGEEFISSASTPASGSQFEFVQQNWCNNPRFGGLTTTRIRFSATTPGPVSPTAT